jgi:hypothetical protein
MTPRAGEIPRRPLGSTGIQVSALGLGGYHIGAIESEREAIRKRAEFMKAAKDFPVVPVVEMDPTCTECDRDNRNGTHDALERTGHLSHPFTP